MTRNVKLPSANELLEDVEILCREGIATRRAHIKDDAEAPDVQLWAAVRTMLKDFWR